MLKFISCYNKRKRNFIIMDYSIKYNKLIEFAKSQNRSKKKSKIYFEEHHIKPASFCRVSKRYGEISEFMFDMNADEADNLVLLTLDEHITAHAYLYMIYGQKMAFAFFSMVNVNQETFDINEMPMICEIYSQARTAYINDLSARMKTDLNPAKNPENRQKMSAAKKIAYLGSGNPNYGKTGINSPLFGTSHLTDVGRQLISDRMKSNNPMKNSEVATRVSEANKGKRTGSQNTNFQGWWITPLGTFESTSVAGKHHNVHPETIRNRCYSARPKWAGWSFQPK